MQMSYGVLKTSVCLSKAIPTITEFLLASGITCHGNYFSLRKDIKLTQRDMQAIRQRMKNKIINDKLGDIESTKSNWRVRVMKT